MKGLSWILLALSVVLFLIGGLSKAMDATWWVAPVAWWRASMASVIYAIALALIHQRA
jgi:hypothetical protein